MLEVLCIHKNMTQLATQDYIASSPQESLSLARPMESSPFVLGLQASAKDNNLAINVSIHVPTASGKMANRSIWVNERGEIESYYDKLHLFDYGSLRESNSVDGGKEIVKPVETVMGRVGLMICFDVCSLVACLCFSAPI